MDPAADPNYDEYRLLSIPRPLVPLPLVSRIQRSAHLLPRASLRPSASLHHPTAWRKGFLTRSSQVSYLTRVPLQTPGQALSFAGIIHVTNQTDDYQLHVPTTENTRVTPYFPSDLEGYSSCVSDLILLRPHLPQVPTQRLTSIRLEIPEVAQSQHLHLRFSTRARRIILPTGLKFSACLVLARSISRFSRLIVPFPGLSHYAPYWR